MAATMQRECSGGIIFAITTKIITYIIVPRNYFVMISARMVVCPCHNLEVVRQGIDTFTRGESC